MSNRIYLLSFVILTLLCASYVHAQPVTLSIPNDLTAMPGVSGLKVPVNVTDVTGLGFVSANLTISYDTNVLTATGIILTDTIAEGSIAFDNADDAEGRVSIALSRAEPYSGGGVLFFVLFDVDSENINDSSPLSLTEAKLNAEEIPVETSDGEITLVTTPPADAVIISIPFLTIIPGTASVQVPVNITSVAGMEVISASLVISYDTNLLSATGASLEGTVSDGGSVSTNIDDAKGEIILVIAKASPISGSGVLVNINFDVDSDVPADKSPLTFKKAHLNSGKVTAVSINGDIFLQIPGDACGADGTPDGQVDIFDLVCIGLHWRETEDNTTASDELFDLLDMASSISFEEPDGVINIYDLIVMADNWLKGVIAAPILAALPSVETTPSIIISADSNSLALQTNNSIRATVGSEFDLNIHIDGVYGLRGYSFDMDFEPDALEIVKGGESKLFIEGDILAVAKNIEPFSISKLMTTYKPDDTLNVNAVILGKESLTLTSGTIGKVKFKAKTTSEFSVALRKIVFFTDAGVCTIPDVTYKVVAHKRVTETKLHQNFPNPFNPETWLPYELASDAPVVISIYNIKGELVRELNLGEQEADYYVTKSKAAHWDGRNYCGEKIASGVYFYRLQAGKFNAIRRMVILK